MTIQERAEKATESSGPCENTDREIWREREGDFYADSIHVTQGGGIGINCGGTVYVRPVRDWHEAMSEIERLRSAQAALEKIRDRFGGHASNCSSEECPVCIAEDALSQLDKSSRSATLAVARDD